MSTQIPQSSFEKIYNDTYDELLKFIIFKCNDLADVNDIIQESYIELFKAMQKQEINDINSFLFGITKNRLKKYYTLKNKIKKIFINLNIDDEKIVNNLDDKLDLERYVFEKMTVSEIWEYLKTKDTIIIKVFYLYYAKDITIKKIAMGLNINESAVKNYLYRTLKELNKVFRKEDN